MIPNIFIGSRIQYGDCEFYDVSPIAVDNTKTHLMILSVDNIGMTKFNLLNRQSKKS
ncbi:protein of unknown function [Xenorhabdus poinarii G6]|uniref:Uncharacterized protein n=1 Tax=Xenorhabdus poinarii G6 TaxID=1354304 RepID=A0A068R6K1_9GAMM|nr:protein of unknown function [Xenorhabdus poinarii G6]